MIQKSNPSKLSLVGLLFVVAGTDGPESVKNSLNCSSSKTSPPGPIRQSKLQMQMDTIIREYTVSRNVVHPIIRSQKRINWCITGICLCRISAWIKKIFKLEVCIRWEINSWQWLHALWRNRERWRIWRKTVSIERLPLPVCSNRWRRQFDWPRLQITWCKSDRRIRFIRFRYISFWFRRSLRELNQSQETSTLFTKEAFARAVSEHVEEALERTGDTERVAEVSLHKELENTRT